MCKSQILLKIFLFYNWFSETLDKSYNICYAFTERLKETMREKTHLKCSDVLPKSAFWGKYGCFCLLLAQYDKLVHLSPTVKLF